MKAILMLLLLSTLACAVDDLDGVAAQVNGDTIPISQLRALTVTRESELRQTLRGQDLVEAIKTYRAVQLNRLIDRLLLLQELKRKGTPLPANATDDQIDATIKTRFSTDRRQWLKRLKPRADILIY
jgi:hypothetical protein